MKHTKKMIMIPEIEYLTLLNMIKGKSDFMHTEKAQTDAMIKDTLEDPKINEETRAKKYNLLYNQRRQLKQKIENRPHKVIIQDNAVPDLVPYLESSKPKRPIDDFKKEELNTPVNKRTYSRRVSPFKGIISKRFADNLEEYIGQNREKFLIHDDGTFDTNVRGRSIKESNFSHVIEYITGERPTISKGFSFLFGRIAKDPLVKEMIRASREEETASDESSSSQSGRGKKRKVVLVSINSPKKKFVPKIWEKL
uniref:Uncharacterized protein n=1 Tax=Meloidogyne enterolobii TaxID=390850 RepID=A0A6V7Y818_MELEN|nr:unnamed protein product [Meloidogyne enterolobii]